MRRLQRRLGLWGWVYGGRYGITRWAYILHRITGLALILYLYAHLFVTSMRVWNRQAWGSFIQLSKTPVMHFLEWLLFLAFAYHVINGIRLLLTEFFGLTIGKPAHPKIPPVTSIKRQFKWNVLFMLLIAGLVVLSGLEFFIWR